MLASEGGAEKLSNRASQDAKTIAELQERVASLAPCNILSNIFLAMYSMCFGMPPCTVSLFDQLRAEGERAGKRKRRRELEDRVSRHGGFHGATMCNVCFLLSELLALWVTHQPHQTYATNNGIGGPIVVPLAEA